MALHPQGQCQCRCRCRFSCQCQCRCRGPVERQGSGKGVRSSAAREWHPHGLPIMFVRSAQIEWRRTTGCEEEKEGSDRIDDIHSRKQKENSMNITNNYQKIDMMAKAFALWTYHILERSHDELVHVLHGHIHPSAHREGHWPPGERARPRGYVSSLKKGRKDKKGGVVRKERVQMRTEDSKLTRQISSMRTDSKLNQYKTSCISITYRPSFHKKNVLVLRG